MNNPERDILEALAPCYPRGLREVVLVSELRVRGTPQSASEMQGHCKELAAKGQITVTAAEDYTLVKITAEGRARLEE